MTRPVRRKRDVAHRQVEGQTVIVLPQSQEAIVLNGTGSRIWDLSDGQRDPAEVAASLTERFDVPLDQALEDVNRFYADMIDAGTMEAVP